MKCVFEFMSICPTNISGFSDYVLNSYIVKDVQFPPSLWEKESTGDSRTTDGVESFHSIYSSQFYNPRPNIYQVIHVLHEV